MPASHDLAYYMHSRYVTGILYHIAMVVWLKIYHKDRELYLPNDTPSESTTGWVLVATLSSGIGLLPKL